MENLENYYGRLLTENQMNSDLKKQAKILPAASYDKKTALLYLQSLRQSEQSW